MNIGINAWTFPKGTSLSDGIALAKRSGFDSVELNLAEDDDIRLTSNEEDIRAVRKSADEAGIMLNSLSTGLHWRYSLTSSDDTLRQQGIDIVRRQLDVAAWMGADTVLVVPGVVTPEVSYDQAYDRAGEALRQLAPEAEARRVSIGIENVWNRFLLSPLEFARFIDEIGSPFVGAYFDVGNILNYGYPDQWIRILGNRIRKVHVKDFKTGIGNIRAFCNLLQGDVPWHKVRSALKEVGYDDTITAEVEGYKTAPELGLRHIADSLRELFKSE